MGGDAPSQVVDDFAFGNQPAAAFAIDVAGRQPAVAEFVAQLIQVGVAVADVRDPAAGTLLMATAVAQSLDNRLRQVRGMRGIGAERTDRNMSSPTIAAHSTQCTSSQRMIRSATSPTNSAPSARGRKHNAAPS